MSKIPQYLSWVIMFATFIAMINITMRVNKRSKPKIWDRFASSMSIVGFIGICLLYYFWLKDLGVENFVEEVIE